MFQQVINKITRCEPQILFLIMEIIRNLAIPGSKQKPVLLDIYYKNNGVQKPMVVFVHGFKGFKDWGHFDLVAKTFAEHDFVFVKFNFSHNGTTPNHPTEFGDLEAFGQNNYLMELNDLTLVLDFVTTCKPLDNNSDKNQMALIGHSRGGGISILKAAEDPRIKKLCTWASVSNFVGRHKPSTIKEWQEKGVVYTMNMRTGQNMPLYYQFYQTIEQNKDRLDVLKAVQKLNIPFLIVHGTKDEAVSVKEAEELHQNYPSSDLLLIENANHVFGAKHPYTESVLPKDAEQVVMTSITFLKK